MLTQRKVLILIQEAIQQEKILQSAFNITVKEHLDSRMEDFVRKKNLEIEVFVEETEKRISHLQERNEQHHSIVEGYLKNFNTVMEKFIGKEKV